MATQLPKSMTLTPETGGKQTAGRFQLFSNPATANANFLVDTFTGQTWELNASGDSRLFWAPVFFMDHGEAFDETLNQLMEMIRREEQIEQSVGMTHKALQSLQTVASKFTDVAQQVNHKVNGGTQ